MNPSRFGCWKDLLPTSSLDTRGFKCMNSTYPAILKRFFPEEWDVLKLKVFIYQKNLTYCDDQLSIPVMATTIESPVQDCKVEIPTAYQAFQDVISMQLETTTSLAMVLYYWAWDPVTKGQDIPTIHSWAEGHGVVCRRGTSNAHIAYSAFV